MTPMINNFGRCGCGRSKTGLCDGSHSISIDEWNNRMIDEEFDDSIFPDDTFDDE